MESFDAPVVFDLNGEQIRFMVPQSNERYFREAKEILNDRLAALRTEYSAFASSQTLVSVLAIEALVDALIVNERYQKLKVEVNSRLESIQTKFDN